MRDYQKPCQFCNKPAIYRVQAGETVFGTYEYIGYACSAHRQWLVVAGEQLNDPNFTTMTLNALGFDLKDDCITVDNTMEIL